MIRPFALARRLIRWQKDRKAIVEAIESRGWSGMSPKKSQENALHRASDLVADLRRLADALEADVEHVAFQTESYVNELGDIPF